MNVASAIVAFVIGVGLGLLLVANLILVLGWSFLSLTALLAALSGQLAVLAQALLAIPALTGSWLALLSVVAVIVVVVFIGYWIASTGTPVPAAPVGLIAAGPAERIGRSALVGFNSGLNLVLLLSLFGALPFGTSVSVILVVINFSACVLAVSNNPIYQVVLAYTGLFLPMSAPMNLVGALVVAVDAAAAALGVPVAPFADWPRANLVMHGGVVHGCSCTAFNLANYSVAHPAMAMNDPWVDPGTLVWPFCPPAFAGAPLVLTNTVNGTLLHESSHTLNVAAFGSIYHLVGFADEWLAMPWSGGVVLGANAHAELCAEGGARAFGRNWLDMWAPSVAGAAVGNTNAIAAVAVTTAAGVVEFAPPTNPCGVAVDGAGNLFVADPAGNLVRRIAGGTGLVATVAGTGAAGFAGDGGPATAAVLAAPSAVVVDAAGNVAVADSGNQRVRRVAAATGVITTAAGTGTAGFSGDGDPATAADLSTPSGIAVDLGGNLLIADTANHRIRRVAVADGVIDTIAGTGAAGAAGDGGPATTAQLFTPSGLAADLNMNLFIADTNNHRVRRVSVDTITTVAGTGVAGVGGDGGPAAAAQISSPGGVAIDASGNVFIADTDSHRIRRVAGPTGVITTVAGTGTGGFAGDGGPATTARLFRPTGVAVDSPGNLFIADAGNGRIRRVAAATGIITTVLGGPTRFAACERNRSVTLDSTGSFDPDGLPLPLGRLWRLTRPPTSAATVGTPNTPTLAFVPDVGGSYRIDLHVTDGLNGGTARGVTGPLAVLIVVLEAVVTPPSAGLTVGTAATFDSAASLTLATGATGPTTFAWTILNAPAGSAVLGMTSTASTLTFTPDVAGPYEVELQLSQTVTPITGDAPVTLTDTARITLGA